VFGRKLPGLKNEFDEFVLAGVVDVALGVEELNE
jgi:hypothetical protein